MEELLFNKCRVLDWDDGNFSIVDSKVCITECR